MLLLERTQHPPLRESWRRRPRARGRRDCRRVVVPQITAIPRRAAGAQRGTTPIATLLETRILHRRIRDRSRVGHSRPRPIRAPHRRRVHLPSRTLVPLHPRTFLVVLPNRIRVLQPTDLLAQKLKLRAPISRRPTRTPLSLTPSGSKLASLHVDLRDPLLHQLLGREADDEILN